MSDPEPELDDQAARRGFWTFWTTVPGILTGAAALLTAVVGLVTVLQSDEDDPTVTTTTGSSASPGSPAGRPEASRPAASRPAASGTAANGTSASGPGSELTLGAGDFADLEGGAVGTSVNGADISLYRDGTGGFSLIDVVGDAMAVPQGGADREGCVAAVTARQDNPLPLDDLPAGSWVCLETGEGHLAALRIVAVPRVGDRHLTVAVTVWQ